MNIEGGSWGMIRCCGARQWLSPTRHHLVSKQPSQIHVRSEVPVDDGAIGRAGCGWVMLSAPGPVPKLDLDLR